VRQVGFLLIPASAISAVLAEPIVRLVYERGEFEPDQTPVVAGALAAFSLGLAFNGVMLLLNRAFFGLQSPHIPTLVAAGNLIFNVLLYIGLHRVGTWGVPLAISIANVAGAVALLLLLRRRIGRLELGRTFGALARIALASAVLAGAAYAVWRGLDSLVGRDLGGQLLSVLGAIAAAGAVYLVVCRALGVREIEALLSLRARFRRA
jgi:putative peptidoglycan lipid II flippase